MEKEIIKTGCRIYDRVVRRDGVDDEGQGSIILQAKFSEQGWVDGRVELLSCLDRLGERAIKVRFWTKTFGPYNLLKLIVWAFSPGGSLDLSN